MYNKKVATFNEGDRTVSLFALALPIFFQSLTNRFIGTGNVLVVSNYSEILVTVTSVTNQIVNLITEILAAVASGMAIIVSVAFGASQKQEAEKQSGIAAVTAFILAVIPSVFLFVFADDTISAMNLTGETALLSATYLKGRAIALPITVVTGVINRYFICNGHSKPILISSVSISAFSVFLSYLFFYVVRLPIDDIAFLVYKNIFICVLHLSLALVLMQKYKLSMKLGFNFRTAFRLLRFGIPVSMCGITATLASTVTTGFVASMGEQMINAKAYINDVVSYVPTFGYAISSAHSIIIGRYRGRCEFDNISLLHKQNVYLTMLTNGALSLLVFIFHTPLLSMFTDDPTIISIAKWVLLIDIPLEIFRAVNNISENSLNPCGDVLVTFLASVLSCWIMGVLLAWVLCKVLGFGLIGLWIAFTMNEVSKAVVYMLRWKSGKWKNANV